MKRTFLGTVTAIKTDGVMGSADIDMKAHGSMHTSSYTIRETEDLALAFAKCDAVRITVETQEPTAKARLDADGTAEPLTRIVHHPPKDACQGPGMPLHNPEYEAADGKRTPLIDDYNRLRKLVDKLSRRLAGVDNNVQLCDICGRPSTDTDVISDEVGAPCACYHCRRLHVAIMKVVPRDDLSQDTPRSHYELLDAWQAFIRRPR